MIAKGRARKPGSRLLLDFAPTKKVALSVFSIFATTVTGTMLKSPHRAVRGSTRRPFVDALHKTPGLRARWRGTYGSMISTRSVALPVGRFSFRVPAALSPAWLCVYR